MNGAENAHIGPKIGHDDERVYVVNRRIAHVTLAKKKEWAWTDKTQQQKKMGEKKV